MSEAGLAVGLVLLSVLLPIGWYGLKDRQSEGAAWSRLETQGWGRPARFFYFIGLPYLAVVMGALPARLLGLKGLEYFLFPGSEVLSFTWVVSQMQKAITLILLEWVVDAGAMIGVGLVALLVWGGIRWGLANSGIELATGSSQLVLDTLYHGLHWAFYRAVFWLLTDDLYLGVVWGAAFVILEGVIIAWLQKRRPAQQPHLLLNAAILMLTSTLFFYSPNLWLLWLFHLAMLSLVRSIKLERLLLFHSRSQTSTAGRK